MKPSNCFVIDKDGEADFVKLVDFGISKVRTSDDGQGAHLTRTNSALGTPLYMSPEQARSPRDVDHRTDLYSVGAILYEMLSGRTPYTAESGEYTEILFKIFTTEPEPLSQLRPDLPEGLVAVVHRALQRDLDARYPTAVDMAEALVPFADERSGQVFTRLRSGRRSQPAPLHSVTPIDEGARAKQSEATARTFASGQPPSLRPPATDVGVSREAGASLGAPRARVLRTGILVALVATAVAVGTGVFALRGRPSSADRVSAGPSAGLPPAESIAIAPPVACAARLDPVPPVVLVPESSAAPLASHPGSPTKPAPRASATAPTPSTTTATTSQAPLPTQLGDLKLH